MNNDGKGFELHDGLKVWCRYDEMCSVKKLKPHPRNPNTHPAAQVERLAKIITEKGWRNPIVVSRQSGYITKGHGRRQAALLSGIKKAPVEYQSYDSPADEIADVVADNMIAEMAEWDEALLAEVRSELEAMDFDVEFAGLDISVDMDNKEHGGGKP
jgi:ParB-like chromosome segregation protein Spo0J